MCVYECVSAFTHAGTQLWNWRITSDEPRPKAELDLWHESVRQAQCWLKGHFL